MAGILIIVLGLSILGPGNMELLAYERNLLCAEVFLDLDNDGWDERLTLTREGDCEEYGIDLSPGQFYRILIDTTVSKREPGWKRVFDSSEHSVMQYFCGDLFYKDKALFRLENKNGNKFPELYFAEWNGNGSPEGVVIIEYVNNRYQILLRATLGLLEFRDLDNDGIVELCGIASFGQIARVAEPSFLVAYTYKDNKYISSYEMTKHLHEERLKKYEEEFAENPNEMSLGWLLGLCAFGGFLDRGKEVISENEDLILQSGSTPEQIYEDFNFLYSYRLESWERVRAGKWM